MGAFPKADAKAAVLAVLAAGALHLGIQCHRANFVLYADPRNPYVYAQTGTDFLRLVGRVEALSALRPEGKRMLVKVVAGPYETWPLPWYLRSSRTSAIGRTRLRPATSGDAPVVVTSADQAERVGESLGSAYRSEFYGLRPGVLLSLFVRNDLWERYLDKKAP